MSKFKIDRLEHVRAGDIVTLRDGDVTITGPARKYASSPTYFYVYSAATEISERTFVSAEREVPDLPTEPGIYIAGRMVDDVKNASILRHKLWGYKKSAWEDSDGEDAVKTAREWAYRAGGLVRLVPEGSEAKKIAEYIRESFDYPATDDIAAGVERGDWNE
jgi:hypothetical protein